MTDIPVGWALRNDLAHQIAARTRNNDDAEDLPHTAYLKLVLYRAKTAITPQFADSAPLQDEVVATSIRLNRTKAGLDKLALQDPGDCPDA